ncbi:MAG TPA: c-type cytochrome [Nitrospirota bacterium]|jgi:cytochrome c6
MKFVKFGVVVFCSTLALGLGAACGNAGSTAGSSADGKKLFEQHCAVCHKDGGNTINPKKTLKKSDMKANGVKSADDVVKLMRNPGPGMSKFDKKTLSDKEAKAVADYVIKTY